MYFGEAVVRVLIALGQRKSESPPTRGAGESVRQVHAYDWAQIGKGYAGQSCCERNPILEEEAETVLTLAHPPLVQKTTDLIYQTCGTGGRR